MSTNPSRFYEFGPFRLDKSERLLLRGEDVVPLTPKAFEVLLVLIESCGHVFTKEELMKRVWPDSFVEEANLSHNVYKLREALGEGRNGEKYIETMPRRGYRFVAKVTELSDRRLDLIVEEHSRARILIEEDDSTSPTSAIEVVDEQGRKLLREARPRRLHLRRPVLLVAMAVLLTTLVATFLYLRKTRLADSAQGPVGLRSIAVLPFKPLATNDRDESLEMGMADTLISRLSTIEHLTVRPFSAIRKYDKLDDEVVQAGRELKVDAVLDGSIQKSGDRLRVRVRLVKVEQGLVVWTEQFDEKFTDIFAVQDSIARRVGDQLAPKLSFEQPGKARPGTANADAYLAYLKGRYFFRKFNPADHQRATQFFNEAITLDPGYSLAYAGLSDTYGSSAVNNWLPSTEAYPKAKTYARKALELDSTLAEAHSTSGAISMFYELDWVTAEREYQQALKLNANHLETYEVYSYFLSCIGRLDEGIEMALRGLQVDPLSVALSDDAAGAYYWARRYDEAIGQCEKSIELDPNHIGAYLFIGQSYVLAGRYDEAIAAYQKAIALSERTSNLLGLLGHAYAVSGRPGDALKILKELTETPVRRYVSPYDLALLYTGLGDKDNAIDQLKLAHEERAGWIVALKVEPMFDSLRSDPRFADLQRKMKFP